MSGQGYLLTSEVNLVSLHFLPVLQIKWIFPQMLFPHKDTTSHAIISKLPRTEFSFLNGHAGLALSFPTLLPSVLLGCYLWLWTVEEACHGTSEKSFQLISISASKVFDSRGACQ